MLGILQGFCGSSSAPRAWLPGRSEAGLHSGAARIRIKALSTHSSQAYVLGSPWNSDLTLEGKLGAAGWPPGIQQSGGR